MARNGSGTYIAPTGNPVITNTVIQSTWANNTVADIGNELTNSLPRDGQAPMLAALKIVDGTANAPGLSFNADVNTGLYRAAAGVLGFAVTGAEQFRAIAGSVLIGQTASTGERLQVTGNSNITGNGVFGGTLGVTGLATLGSASVTTTLGVTGLATLGSASVTTTLGVTGNTTLTGTLAPNNTVVFGANYTELSTAVTAAASTTINCALGNNFAVAMNASITTLTISNVPASGRTTTITLFLKQDATGSRLVTWPGAVKWSAGSAPALTTTANKTDVITLVTFDAGTTWFGFSSLNF